MKPLVSVIVPIYNVEKYLRCCIDSLLKQTLTNIEIILVDDGSPDNCGAIIDEYQEKDERIRVVHQVNQGLGPARNSGMRLAKGEYIGFVDSDDYVQPTMYESLYKIAKSGNFDIVTGGHKECLLDGQIKDFPHPLAGTHYYDSDKIRSIRKRFYGHLYKIDGKTYLPVSAWRSIYRRQIIVENNLSFMEILSEDIFFDLDIYPKINSVAFSNSTDYCYRKEGQPSITRSFSENKLARYRDALVQLYHRAQKETDYECMRRFKCHSAGRCREYARLVKLSNSTFNEKKNYFKQFLYDRAVKECYNGLDLHDLPLKQRIFHLMVLSKLYGLALRLVWC